jgi:hypothetical protein
MTALDDLHHWYLAQCDGDWEHSNGISIETLDNPGWSVKIDLSDTRLDGIPFTPFETGDSQGDQR